MQNDFSTIKTSNLYFPKLHVIRARKKKKMNYFLKQNNNFYLNINFDLSNEKLKTNYLSINTFKLRNQNYPQTPPNTFRCKIQNPPTNPKINRYSYRKLNEVNKNNNHRTITKEKINKIYYDLLKKKKNISKLKSQGIATSDSFYKRNNKSKIYFRNLSLGKEENNMDNFSSFNNDMIKEIYMNKNEKNSKKNFPLTNGVTSKLLKDKYAYIYMSDKCELIKYWRRINYNPLNV